MIFNLLHQLPLRQISAYRILLALSLMLTPFVVDAQTGTGSHIIRRSERTARTIGLNTHVERAIVVNEVHDYRINLFPNQFLRVKVTEYGGVDLFLSLLGPRNQKVAEVGDLNGPAFDTTVSIAAALGSETLSFVVRQQGVYRLVVAASDSAANGRYELEVTELRQANETDTSRVMAESAFAEAERLRRGQWNESTLRASKNKYLEALKHWREVGDKVREADVLNSIGALYYDCVANEQACTTEMAIEQYEKALARWREAGDLRGEAVTLQNMGHLQTLRYNSRDSKDIALEHFQLALNHWRVLGNESMAARALFQIARVYHWAQNAEKALEFFEHSLQSWRIVDDKPGEATTWFSLAETYNWLGDTQKALDSYDQSLKLAQASGYFRMEIAALLRTGEIYLAEGEFQTALDFYNKALTRGQSKTRPREEAYTLYDIGVVFFALGDWSKALDYFQQALPLWEGQFNGEAYTRAYIGRIHESLSEREKALQYYNRALELIRMDVFGRTDFLNLVGLLHESSGDSEQGAEYFNQALNLSRKIRYRRGEARTLVNLGRTLESLGQEQKAADHYATALTIFRAVRDRSGEAQALYQSAKLEAAQGNLNNARTTISQAVDIVESLRQKIGSEDLRASYFASAHRFYELYVQILMQQHSDQPRDGIDAAAFQVSERARARTLLELLSEAGVDLQHGVSVDLGSREGELKRLISAKSERYTRLLNGEHSREQAEALAKEIESVEIEYRQLTAKIRHASPKYASLIQPQPLSVKKVQELLDSETLLLEYMLGDERSYLWAVTATSINSYELPKRTKIEKEVRHAYELLTTRNTRKAGESPAQRLIRLSKAETDYGETAARLSDILLGPVASQLGTKRLLIIGDGALQYFPFSALIDPAHNSEERQTGQPLIVNHEIINLPSASTLAILRQARTDPASGQKTVAVFADPVFEKDDPRVKHKGRRITKPIPRPWSRELERTFRDLGVIDEKNTLSRLPFTREEAKGIVSLIPEGKGMLRLDFGANLSSVKSGELSHYRIIHFATHGILNTQHPTLSGIVLSLVNEHGEPQDGFLRLHDIYKLDLAADLVVLSACQTGLGKQVRGEGVIGLTRGFMYAGTKRVVASLWKVGDEIAFELMKHFYHAMLREGKTPSAALRATQIEMWRQKHWRSPYYWAAFQIQGEFR